MSYSEWTFLKLLSQEIELCHPPRWLILCVNLTGLRDVQIAGKTVLGVSRGVFLEEIRIWFSRLSKQIWLQCGQASPNLFGAEQDKKSKEKIHSLSLPELWHPSFPTTRYWSSWFSGLRTPALIPVTLGSQAFSLKLGVRQLAPLIIRPLDMDWTIPPAFLVLYLADSKLWDFSVSITLWDNSYGIYTPHVSLLLVSVSLENPNTSGYLSFIGISKWT